MCSMAVQDANDKNNKSQHAEAVQSGTTAVSPLSDDSVVANNSVGNKDLINELPFDFGYVQLAKYRSELPFYGPVLTNKHLKEKIK